MSERKREAKSSADATDRQQMGGLELPSPEQIVGARGEHGVLRHGEPIVRRAKDTDVESIGRLYALEARLEEQLGGYSLIQAFNWTRWAAARLQARGHRFFVAQRNGTLVAFVHARLRSPPVVAGIPEKIGWGRRAIRALWRQTGVSRATPMPAAPARFEEWGIIESLYVIESERRRGLGRQLVEVAKNDLTAMGATRIEISVMDANEAAMAFWAGLGFRPFRAHLVSRIDQDRAIR